MRDPARIGKVLKVLEKLWVANPDMRLGQIIGAAIGKDEYLFWVEDDELLDELEGLDFMWSRQDAS